MITGFNTTKMASGNITNKFYYNPFRKKKLDFPPKVVIGCIGKKRHESQGKADAHIRWMIKREKPDTDRLRSYYCVRCHGWHVGNVKQT